MPFDEAAAFLMTYGTSYYGLKDRGHLKAGETLLVLGAAGGVGLAAVELGKAMGAQVIAAASSQEKVDLCLAHGADAGVVYPAGPFDRDGQKALADLFKQACGAKGADVVYDGVGGDYAEAALRSIAWEGRFLVIGFPAGIPRIPLNLALLKGLRHRRRLLGRGGGARSGGPPGQRQGADGPLRRRQDQAPRLRALPPGARRRSHRPPRRSQGARQGRGDHRLA